MPFTLGWCYLSDYYAPQAEAILDELRLCMPGVDWVGTAGFGVAASGVEYIDEPALVLMLAPLPRESFRLFSGRQPLPGASSGFVAHTALVHTDGSAPDLQELIHELSARTATGYLFGGPGNNVLTGGSGQDFLVANGGGTNVLNAGSGYEVLEALGAGTNTLIGGSGYDTMITFAGTNHIVGGSGSDFIVALGGQNTIDGGSGTSYVYSFSSTDVIHANSGMTVIRIGY